MWAHNGGMTEFDADAILDDYIARHPHARAAQLDDPLFVAQMDLLRRTLALLEPVLRREGLDRFAVRRVVNTLVYGVPDPDAAIGRVLDFRARVEVIRWASPAIVVEGELAEHLAGLAGGEGAA